MNEDFHSIMKYNNTEFICYNRKFTIKNIINGIGFIRFGDGEFNLMKNLDIHFQTNNSKFKLKFEEIINNPQ
jgi:hypothetical protein